MPQRFKYEVILYSVNGKLGNVVIAATFDNLPMARLALKQIISPNWRNTRDYHHVIGDLVCTIRTKGADR